MSKVKVIKDSEFSTYNGIRHWTKPKKCKELTKIDLLKYL